MLQRKNIATVDGIDINALKVLQNSDKGIGIFALAGTVSTTALEANSLYQVKSSYDTSDIYGQMEQADNFCKKDAIPQRLALWRATLWGQGFKISHPHPSIRTAYQKFSDKYNLNLLVMDGMRHLSIMNNASLIWRVKTTGKLEYVMFYNPAFTRIDQVGGTLWCKPDEQFTAQIKEATEAELKKFKSRYGAGSSVGKWVDAVKNATGFGGNMKYKGYVPLESDGPPSKRAEWWEIFNGSGGSSQTSYGDVTMASVFLDLELVRLLYEGDWSTAWMIKNLIMLVKAGESIESGPLAGSKRNYATMKDLSALQTVFQKVGKTQNVYADHTVTVEFVFPDPKIFSPEKYDAVIDRICWYFGIGKYMILGSGDGASYSASTWNIQSIRTEAKRMREVFRTHFLKFLTHQSVVSEVFSGLGDIYDHDCVGEVRGNTIILSQSYADLAVENIGFVEYGKDGDFSSPKKYSVIASNPDNNSIIVSGLLPDGCLPNEVRLVFSPRQGLSLYGAPTITFDERVIRDDAQVLKELQELVQQGPLSNLTYLQQLGFDFEEEMANKAREWKFRSKLWPIFEKSQSLLLGINTGLEDLSRTNMDDVSNSDGGNGSPGRPKNQDGDNPKPQDVNPRPSDNK